MKINRSVAVFHVGDLEVSLRYYRDILGFTEEFKHDGYVGLKMGAAGLHLMSHQPSGTAYFFCDEVDGYYAQINEKGALVQGEPQEYFYGMRDFIVADPDGNHVTFGAPGAGS